MSQPLVMKFGGSTIGTSEALSQVLSIVLHEQKRWPGVILVASALDGVTDDLLQAAHLAQLANRRGYRRIAALLRTRHMALVEQLPLGNVERTALQADIDKLLFDMLDICQTAADTPSDSLLPQISDSIIGVGERLSARIIAALLRQNGLRGVAIDATDIIITDATYGNASPLMDETKEKIHSHLLPMLSRQIVPVVTGFIGATQAGHHTTLGRGGSDYTASILSVCVDAAEVWVWVDVDGMMSSDPREIPDARVIAELSYNEVAELAYFGARILHTRMIAPLRDKSIRLRIKNVFKPQGSGTLIHNTPTAEGAQLKAVTMIQALTLTAEHSGSLSRITSLIDHTLFSMIGSHADVMISAQSSSRSLLCFIIPTTAGSEAVDVVQDTLQTALASSLDSTDWKVEPAGVVTIIGVQLDQSPQMIGQMMGALRGVRLLAVAQGPSHCSFSMVLTRRDAEIALRQIHNLIVKNG